MQKMSVYHCNGFLLFIMQLITSTKLSKQYGGQYFPLLSQILISQDKRKKVLPQTFKIKNNLQVLFTLKNSASNKYKLQYIQHILLRKRKKKKNNPHVHTLNTVESFGT